MDVVNGFTMDSFYDQVNSNECQSLELVDKSEPWSLKICRRDVLLLPGS